MRVFVSHAWEDKRQACALSQLPPYVKAWVDVRELAVGQMLDPVIVEAIEDSHIFLSLVSAVSVTKPYVCKELDWALGHEAVRDRVFVMPVMLDRGFDLATAEDASFRRLAGRLYVDATDHSAAGQAAALAALSDNLFRWVSDWLDRLEPRGDHDRRFVEALEGQLVEFRIRLFAVKAALAWPLATLVQPDAIAHLIEVKDRYNTFTESFVPQLARLDDEVRWRFGGPAQRGYKRLRDFIVDEVYQGAAFALNDVIESVNAWEPVLSHDAAAAAAGEARREQRLQALQPVLAELVQRSTEFIQTLKS